PDRPVWSLDRHGGPAPGGRQIVLHERFRARIERRDLVFRLLGDVETAVGGERDAVGPRYVGRDLPFLEALDARIEAAQTVRADLDEPDDAVGGGHDAVRRAARRGNVVLDDRRGGE